LKATVDEWRVGSNDQVIGWLTFYTSVKSLLVRSLW